MFGLFKKKRQEEEDDAYKPRLFLRLRNNGTYFISKRTHKVAKIDYELGYASHSLGYTSHSYNWEEIEAGTSLEEAEEVLNMVQVEIKADEDLKKSLESVVIKSIQLR